MKKIFTLGLLIFISQNLIAQCSNFLGGDRSVMPCSNPFTINFGEVFVGTNPLLNGATFQSTLLEPTDIKPGQNGAPDTTIHLTSKVRVVATATNGCTDVAIVRVLVRREPLPNLGP